MLFSLFVSRTWHTASEFSFYIFIFKSQMNVNDRFRSSQSHAEYLRELFTTVRIA